MATAEKEIVERAPPSPERRLVRSSLLGALYVLASVYLVCAGLPWFWTEVLNLRNEFLSGALLVLVEMAAIAGVVFLGRALEGPQPVHGLRAGVFFFCLFFLIDLWISYRLAWGFGEDSGSGGMIGSLVAFVGIGLFFFWMVRKPGFARFLQRTEDRGWFHATAYKPNQGLKVRRSTVVALLVLGLCGVITLTRTLGSDRPGPNNQTISNDWEMTIPFAGEPGSSLGADFEDVAGATPNGVVITSVEPRGPADKAKLKVGDVVTKVDDDNTNASSKNLRYEVLAKKPANEVVKLTVQRGGEELNMRVLLASGHPVIPLLYKVHLTLPLILAGLIIWLSWRVVNLPVFGDFLIATEAEMNKVSWTTPRRLRQDTLVVLVTVILLATFLFVIDLIWINVLSWRVIGVLQVDIRQEALKQQEKTQW